MALLLAVTLFHGSVFAENISSISSGAKIFKKCQNCHQIGEDAKNRVGPQLNNIFGRSAGVLPGVKYSKNMVQAGEEGLVWNNETLNSFIKNPKGLIAKTRMSFRGLKKEDDRKNLLLYLSEFSKKSSSSLSASNGLLLLLVSWLLSLQMVNPYVPPSLFMGILLPVTLFSTYRPCVSDKSSNTTRFPAAHIFLTDPSGFFTPAT